MVSNCDGYTASEVRTISLKGEIKGHPTHRDGYVRTSDIVGVKDRFVFTKTGSVYRLGRISKKYRKWLKK